MNHWIARKSKDLCIYKTAKTEKPVKEAFVSQKEGTFLNIKLIFS